MSTKQKKQAAAWIRRKKRVRKKVNGTAERPRLVVNRSLKYMAASLVDDFSGRVMTGATTKTLDLSKFELPKDPEKYAPNGVALPLKGKVADAFRLGMAVASIAKEQGVESVVFDRNGLRYHGRVRAVAEGARQGGLKV